MAECPTFILPITATDSSKKCGGCIGRNGSLRNKLPLYTFCAKDQFISGWIEAAAAAVEALAAPTYLFCQT